MKIDVPVTDESFLEMVKEQLAKVSAEYGHKYNSTNEFYGVLHEEVHEILHAVQEGKGFVTSDLLGKMIKACSTMTGTNPEPVSKGRGFENYIGDGDEPNCAKTDNPRTNKYSHNVWRRYASPVWMDINQTRTLNEKLAREKDDERHMSPLQLDVIERCIELWSNPDDTVLSPFAGIGSEGYCALQMGRKFIGSELKKSYFNVAVKNMAHAINSNSKQLSLL